MAMHSHWVSPYLILLYTLVNKDARPTVTIGSVCHGNRSKQLLNGNFKVIWKRIVRKCSSVSYTQKDNHIQNIANFQIVENYSWANV